MANSATALLQKAKDEGKLPESIAKQVNLPSVSPVQQPATQQPTAQQPDMSQILALLAQQKKPTIDPNYINEQTARINSMYDNLKGSSMVQANAQRQQTQEALRRELATKLPQYQTQRAQADVGQQQNFNKLKEYMAGNGAFSSGDNLSRAGNIITARANAVNQTNGDQNAYELSNAQSMNDANTQYSNAVNQINSQYDAQKMQALMNLQSQLRSEDYQAGRDLVLDNRYNDQFNYQKQQDAQQLEMTKAQIDYQKQQDAISNTYRQNSFEWQKSMQELDNEFRNKQAQIQQSQWGQQFDYAQQRDTVGDNQWQQQFDYTKQNNAQNRASSGSSTSSTKAIAEQKTRDIDGVWNELYNQIDSRTAETFLQQNRTAIIENLGSAEYNKMLKYAKDYTYSANENKQYSQRTNNRTPMDYVG